MILTTQELLFCAGKEIVNLWLDHNDIPRPIILRYDEHRLASPLVWYQKPGDRLEWDKKGLYFCGHCFVNVEQTCTPSAIGDWPGYLIDDTAMGVLAHEMGHYVWHWLQLRIGSWRECLGGKRRTGKFESDPEEAWAETIRLFILNPALVKAGLPKRWAFITGPDVRLRPLPQLMKRSWRAVLGNKRRSEEVERWLQSA